MRTKRIVFWSACLFAALAFWGWLLTPVYAANSNEVLNLELNCGGKLTPLFAKYEDEQRYTERQKWAATAIDESFSQRVSIIDNFIGDMPLVVEDNWVKIDNDFVNFNKAKGVHIDGFIDRLIGAVEFSVTIDEDSEFSDKWAEVSPMVNDELRGINGFRFNGVCEKLDPKKKVF